MKIKVFKSWRVRVNISVLVLYCIEKSLCVPTAKLASINLTSIYSTTSGRFLPVLWTIRKSENCRYYMHEKIQSTKCDFQVLNEFKFFNSLKIINIFFSKIHNQKLIEHHQKRVLLKLLPTQFINNL